MTNVVIDMYRLLNLLLFIVVIVVMSIHNVVIAVL
jgi:hypothetical protein